MPVDVSRALELKQKHGLTFAEIGKQFNVSKQRVHQLLKPLIPDKDLADQLRANMNDIIAFVQFKGLNAYLSLTDEEQKDMIKRRGLVDMGIAYDKGRLEAGLSTANLSMVHQVVADMKEAKRSKPST